MDTGRLVIKMLWLGEQYIYFLYYCEFRVENTFIYSEKCKYNDWLLTRFTEFSNHPPGIYTPYAWNSNQYFNIKFTNLIISAFIFFNSFTMLQYQSVNVYVYTVLFNLYTKTKVRG